MRGSGVMQSYGYCIIPFYKVYLKKGSDRVEISCPEAYQGSKENLSAVFPHACSAGQLIDVPIPPIWNSPPDGILPYMLWLAQEVSVARFSFKGKSMIFGRCRVCCAGLRGTLFDK